MANTIESQGRVACPRQRESCCVAFAQDSMLFLGASVAGHSVTQLGIFEVFIVSLMVKRYSSLLRISLCMTWEN